MNKDIVVFRKKCTGETPVTVSDIAGYDLKVWRPGISRFVPPRRNYKYLVYWLFHVFRIFRNPHYSAYFLYDNDEVVSSLMVVPSYFKWPFMNNKDVQFTYVMTNKKYRGQGVAGKLIERAMSDLSLGVEAFWYVTDTKNRASIKVAEKLGFQCYGKAERNNLLKILKLSSFNN